MTYEERQDYDKLSASGKKAYDRDVEDHPNRSHSQHLAKAKLSDVIDVNIDKGKNVDETSVLKDILTEAKEWLVEIGGISLSVLSALDDAISELGRAIGNGIRWIGNKLGDLFDWIFS